MTQEMALRILETPVEYLNLSSDYYKAIFHLAKYPGSKTENALLKLIRSTSKEQSIRIAKRKAVEVLARIGCHNAIPAIGECLDSDDHFLVENSAWALQTLSCKDVEIHLKMIDLLEKSKYHRRALIKSLSKLKVTAAIQKIENIFYNQNDKSITDSDRGACIVAISNLCGDRDLLYKLEKHLFLQNQNQRFLAIQDVIDGKALELIPAVLRSPVSVSFRLKAIESIWPDMEYSCKGKKIFQIIDALIIDNPRNIATLHSYSDETPLDELVNNLFSTDFSRSYASLTILIGKDVNKLWQVIIKSINRFTSDYGALYFLILLFRLTSGWRGFQLKKISELSAFALDEQWPEYMKFKPISIITLMHFDHERGIDFIPRLIDFKQSKYWPLRYAAIIALEELILGNQDKNCFNFINLCKKDPHPLIRTRANLLQQKIESL